MDIDNRKLRHLVMVARYGNFSKAAHELNITQPALSRSIAAIEDQLGLRIFERSSHGAELTRLGKSVVREAETLLTQGRIFQHNLTLFAEGKLGSVAFGMWPVVGSLVLPGLSTHLITERPRLSIWASVKSPNALLQDLRDDRIEMLFCGSDQVTVPPDMEVEHIGTIHFVVLVRDGHPLPRHHPVKRSELFVYPKLCAVELSQIPADLLDNGIFVCDNFDVLRHTALTTDSIWFAPVEMAKHELEQGLIRELTVTEPVQEPAIDICRIQLKGYQLSPAAEAVAAYVRNYFQQRP